LNKSNKKSSAESAKKTETLIKEVEKKIIQEKLLKTGDRVLLGISGGIDSSTLLYVLLEIQNSIEFSLGLAHVNHMLRGRESERDERFVKKIARRFQLPLHLKRINIGEVAHEKNLSIQHAGREARYSYFDEVAAKYGYNKIAMAHNLDDQIETMLLRALKGTGLRGLTAIPIKRDKIIRPFLNTYRSEIEVYANLHKIPFVEDSSNNKVAYERNFLRRKIFPVMAKLNPQFKEKLFSLLKDLTYINSLFETKSRLFLKQHKEKKKGEISLAIANLNMIDDETKFRVISDVVASLDPAFVPLREHFRQIKNILSAKQPNLVAMLPHEIKVKKVYDNLLFTKKPLPPPIEETFSISTGKNNLKPFALCLYLSQSQKIPKVFPRNNNVAFFDSEKLGRLTVRTFMNGDRFMPLGMKEKMKLKDFFISSKIPKETRIAIPLLLSDNEIIWVVGLRIDERFKITKDTKQILKVKVARHSGIR